MSKTANVSEINVKLSETNLKEAEISAKNSAIEAQSWTIGGTGTREGKNTITQDIGVICLVLCIG